MTGILIFFGAIVRFFFTTWLANLVLQWFMGDGWLTVLLTQAYMVFFWIREIYVYFYVKKAIKEEEKLEFENLKSKNTELEDRLNRIERKNNI